MNTSLVDVFPKICDDENDVVIVANGDFPKDEFLITLIKKAKFIIVCDGALHHLIERNIEPHCIVGDCDSIEDYLAEQYKHKIIHIKEQSSNDLSKALCLAREKKFNQIVILGATGLREDHTLGNISILAQNIHHFKDIKIVSEYGVFTAHDSNTCLKTIPHQQISFFSFNPITTITCQQLKWQLDNFKMDFWNQATLNETLGNHVDLKINDGIVIVFRTFEIRN